MIAVHVAESDQVFILPVEDCPRSDAYLRLDAAKNNQRRGIRFAVDYGFDRWAARIVGQHQDDRPALPCS